MAVQQQSRQESPWWDDEEEEEVQERSYTTGRHSTVRNTTVRKSAPKEKRRFPFGKLAAAVVLIATAFTGMQFYNKTTLFADKQPAPAGYLSLEDYTLIDENGNALQNTDSLFNEDAWIYYGDGQSYTTTLGIAPGDSWETFVETYGDYTANTISAYPIDDSHIGNPSESFWDDHYFSYMKIADFDRDYIQTGILSLAENDIYVTFEVQVYGRTVAYTEAEYEDLIDRHYGSSFPDGSILDPYIQYYSLDFSFHPADQYWRDVLEDGTLYSIDVYHDAY